MDLRSVSDCRLKHRVRHRAGVRQATSTALNENHKRVGVRLIVQKSGEPRVTRAVAKLRGAGLGADIKPREPVGV